MSFSVDLADVILYCVQQLGVMLAVGAESIVLVAYIVSMFDRKVDETEARFSRAIRRALISGLWLVIISGALITALHLALGEGAIVESPVFLFKWLLIAGLACLYLYQRQKPFLPAWAEGAVGGTWYALFLVHILAPITTWFALAALYVVFAGGFALAWTLVARLMHPREASAPAKPPEKLKMQAPVAALAAPVSAPKPIAAPLPPKPAPVPIAAAAPPPPAPKTPAPAMALAQSTPQLPAKIVQPALPPPPPEKIIAPVAPPPPTPPKKEIPPDDPRHSFWLPAIHIMPRSQADLDAKSHLMPLAAITKTT